jgi:hypothetical protein
MSIDRSGKWWVGTDAGDIQEYLKAYSSDSYPIAEFRKATCTCGGDAFLLLADDDEGCARRMCTSCGEEKYICDSAEYWSDASPEEYKCVECNSAHANIGVGFSLYQDGEIRWLYVGERCAACGVLGCFAGWKIGYAPSKHLFEQV